MIHNSMIQSADRRRSSKGFTLLEMLIAVGVLVILLCISMIAVPSYVRGMTQLERDGIAKEIFVAAQNNLSMAYSQGYPGCTEFGTPETEILGENVCGKAATM